MTEQSPGPTVASVLGAAARGPRWWSNALAQQPLVVATVLAAVAVCVALVVVRPADWLAEAAHTLLNMSWLAILPIREWVLRRQVAAGRPMSPPAWRAPVDVTGSAPVRPRWTWNGPLGRTCLAFGLPLAAWAAAFAVGAVLLPRGPDGGDGGVVAAVIVGVLAVPLALAAWFALDNAPGQARAVARSTRPPTTVRVLGIEPDGQHWLLRPVDGGGTVRLGAFRGRTRLVAGDVVHLWPPYTSDVPEGHHRAALTGPFGTVWPMVDGTPSRDARHGAGAPEAASAGRREDSR